MTRWAWFSRRTICRNDAREIVVVRSRAIVTMSFLIVPLLSARYLDVVVRTCPGNGARPPSVAKPVPHARLAEVSLTANSGRSQGERYDIFVTGRCNADVCHGAAHPAARAACPT